MRTIAWTLCTAVAAVYGVDAASAGNFLPLGGLVVDEGETVGDGPVMNCGVSCCQRRCAATPGCNSFSLHGSAKLCFLKARCIPDGTTAVRRSKYTTWRAAECGRARDHAETATAAAAASAAVPGIAGAGTVDTAAAAQNDGTDERAAARAAMAANAERNREATKQAKALAAQRKATAASGAATNTVPRSATHQEVAVDAATGTVTAGDAGAVTIGPQHLVSLIQRVHEYCISEMYSNKWEGKAGSNLGAPIVKKRLENSELTFCSNRDWRASAARLGYDASDPARFRALFPPRGSDPCSADQLYHYTGSGVGSWMSNIANLLHVHDKAGTTLGFRDQRPNGPDGSTTPNKRYGLLLGHVAPECTAGNVQKKTRVMVSPNAAGSLLAKSSCDYAAVKHYFSHQLWKTAATGALRRTLEAGIAEQDAAMHAAAVAAVESDGGESPGEGVALPYIGLHLRHKWEFKLTPPRVGDVAAVLRAVAAQLDPSRHTELADAELAPGGGNHKFWGEKPLVYCASDLVETCGELQRELAADGFRVVFADNFKQLTKESGIVNYLLDIAMLEKAAVFVGTGSSNLSRWTPDVRALWWAVIIRSPPLFIIDGHVNVCDALCTRNKKVNAIRGPDKLSCSLDVDYNAIHF